MREDDAIWGGLARCLRPGNTVGTLNTPSLRSAWPCWTHPHPAWARSSQTAGHWALVWFCIADWHHFGRTKPVTGAGRGLCTCGPREGLVKGRRSVADSLRTSHPQPPALPSGFCVIPKPACYPPPEEDSRGPARPWSLGTETRSPSPTGVSREPWQNEPGRFLSQLAGSRRCG